MKARQEFSLTQPQRRIWFSEILYPGTAFANMGYTLRLEKSMEYQLTEQVLNTVVEKNEGLRLRLFESEEDVENGVRQYLSPHRAFSLDFFKFENNHTCQEWIDNQMKQPFGLFNEDLFYFALLNIDNENILYIKIHHLIGDGGTFMVLARQISKLYAELEQGGSITTDNYPSYLSYLKEEQIYKGSVQYIEDKRFWNELFTDMPEEVSLSIGKRKKTDILRRRQIFRVSQELGIAVGEYCAKYEITIYELILAAFYTYTARVTGKYDLVIGVPYHESRNQQTKEMVGMFVSTLPCRLRLTDSLEFNKVAKQVRQNLREQIVHSRYPYNWLIEDLRKKDNNITDFMKVFVNQAGMMHIGNNELQQHMGPDTNQEFMVRVNPNVYYEDGFQTLGFEYQTSVFEDTEVTRIFQRLITLLADAIANPCKKISELEIIPKGERQQLLAEFQGPEYYYPKDKTVQELFSAQVLKQPDKIALVFKNQQYTYRQLEEKTDSLAMVLRSKGVKPNTSVPILVFLASKKYTKRQPKYT